MIKPSKLEMIYGKEQAAKVLSSNVLVVGAGGIGCELMKTLSVTGFQKITIIDLDTIDVSNLNRQFLFRREHVDKSKAEVVREQIIKQNPKIEVYSYVGKIQEERFGFKFFSQFDIVINALDNEEARKHVNNYCFNLGIPLVDSGTNGYEATCMSICKGKTPCYQCIDRVKDQSFPVCTIRQKPERLIHCIVWAKALFEGLFGPKEQTNNIIEDIISEISSSSGDKLQYAQIVFDRMFHQEVKMLYDNLAASKVQQAQIQEDKEKEQEFLQKIKIIEFEHFKEQTENSLKDENYFQNQEKLNDENSLQILQLKDYVFSFVKSIMRIYEERKDLIGSLSFNKDDDLIIDFVSAATNIRAFNFSIPMESKFKIKEMAGKIIPAISSSNALVASLQVIEAIKILGKQYDQLYGIVYQRLNPLRIQSFKRINDVTNPNCQICSDDSKYIYCLEVKDLKSFTLKILVHSVIYGEWKMNESIQIEFNSNILYEQDNGMDEDEIEIYQNRLKKSLCDLKIKDQSIVSITGSFKDQSVSDQYSIYVQIIESSSLESDYRSTLLKKATMKPKSSQSEQQQFADQLKKAEIVEKGGVVFLSDGDGTDELQMMEEKWAAPDEEKPNRKRSTREEPDLLMEEVKDDGPTSKKQKTD